MKTTNTSETIIKFIPEDQWDQAMSERATDILHRMGREPTSEAIEEIKADCLIEGFTIQEERLELVGR